MIIRTTIFASAALATFASAATVSINATIARAYESDATTFISDDTIGILVADINGTGFGSLNSDLVGFDLGSTINPTTGGTQTLIGGLEVLGIYQSVDGGYFVSAPDVELDSNLTTGDSLALVWLPGLTTTSGNITEGQSFGVATGFTGTDNNLGSAAFEVPTQGTSPDMAYLEQSLGGNLANNSLVADMQAIPEPSSFALLGLGAVATLFRRRR